MINKFQDDSFYFHNNTLIIDESLCEKSNIVCDNWNRTSVTPLAVACYAYQSFRVLGYSGEAIYKAIMNRWDTFFWGNSPISINIWNDLFRGYPLREDQWKKILIPLKYIDTIYTNVTSPNTKAVCYPVFFGETRSIPGELMICTKTSYNKTMIERKATKTCMYRYGEAADCKDILQGLRNEVTRVVLPFDEIAKERKL